MTLERIARDQLLVRGGGHRLSHQAPVLQSHRGGRRLLGRPLGPVGCPVPSR
ncbi:hypothetical protein J0S82_017486 [Galemys pyrenaicus]|uniref:Uncharacterized protein n=1 Tax=Galemys pyrenaicus TaxID=202257 RepID=A0A8J5ZXR9_GALPY|nr:hypothetical protein J0S82_017486 [Galemys pyrenaicus]